MISIVNPLLFTIIASVLIFCGQLECLAFQRDHVYTVRGTIVDSTGKPVSGAVISMKSPDVEEGDIVETELSDGVGHFTIQRRARRLVRTWALYVSDYSLVRKTHTPLDPHMGTILSHRCCKTLRGLEIHPSPGIVVNLGKIKVTDKQYRAPIFVQTPDGKQFVKASWLTIRDKFGDIVAEGGYGGETIALPEGTWRLEVTDQDGPTYQGESHATISSDGPTQETTITVKKVEFAFAGHRDFGNRRSEARK